VLSVSNLAVSQNKGRLCVDFPKMGYMSERTLKGVKGVTFFVLY
jgi:hypothetical protein